MAGKHFDEDALTALFDQYAAPIYKYVVRFCRNPDVGDNIVGDAFAQLLEEFAPGKVPPSDPRLYLYQTVYTSIGRHLHDDRFASWAESAVRSPEIAEPSPSQSQGDGHLTEDALFTALYPELTEIQRHVMSLYYLDDFSVRDTANILRKSVNEIKGSLRGIRKIMDHHPDLRTDLLTKKKRKR